MLLIASFVLWHVLGLGRKTLHLLENGDSDDLHEAVMDAFPSLKNASGYELLRLDENFRRVLEVIPSPPNGYNAEFLKESVHHAKIYIRPMQRNLPLEKLPPDMVSKTKQKF